MKMVKKLLAVALAGVLALSVLTGCSNDSTSIGLTEALKSQLGATEVKVGAISTHITNANLDKAIADATEAGDAVKTATTGKTLDESKKAAFIQKISGGYSDLYRALFSSADAVTMSGYVPDNNGVKGAQKTAALIKTNMKDVKIESSKVKQIASVLVTKDKTVTIAYSTKQLPKYVDPAQNCLVVITAA